MKETIRYILKEETSLQKRVKNMLYDLGYIKTIKAVAGYNNIVKILGDDFFTKERKIELIGDIAYQFGTRGELYLYEYDLDIMINKDTYADGSFDASYITYLEDNGNFYYKSYNFDKDGWMDDNEFDEGYMPLPDLSENTIDDILVALTDKFL
jgi:hypothetical protein